MSKTNIFTGAFIPTPTANDFKAVVDILCKFGYPRQSMLSWNRNGENTYIRPIVQDGSKVVYVAGFSLIDNAQRLNSYKRPQDFVIDYMPRFAVDEGVKASQVFYCQINVGVISSSMYGDHKIDLDPQSMYVMGYDIHQDLGPVYLIGIIGAPKTVGFAVKFEDLHRIVTEETQRVYGLGSAVKISGDSPFYLKENDEDNPTDVLGVVVHHFNEDNPFHLRVQWANGRVNAYSPNDLQLLGNYFEAGDHIQVKEGLPYAKTIKNGEVGRELFGKRVVTDVQVIDGRLLVSTQPNVWFDSSQFTLLGKSPTKNEWELYREYPKAPGVPTSPPLGTRTQQDMSQYPEYWKQVTTSVKAIEKGDLVYVIHDLQVTPEMTMTTGNVLLVEKVGIEKVWAFGDFELPLSSIRLATTEEINEKKNIIIGGVPVEYLGDGVKIGALKLFADEFQGLQTVMELPVDVSILIEGYAIDYPTYFYLHQFSGLPYDMEDFV